MSRPTHRPQQALLPAAELVAAWVFADGEPGFYWSAVERVMADVCAPAGDPDALARLIFGLSALGGILLQQLADHSGRNPVDVLGAITAA